jgi:hypothetical protein
MKPLYDITDSMKYNFINGVVFDEIKKIEARVNLWFENAYILTDRGENDEVSLSNLMLDLDYMFSKIIWFIDEDNSKFINKTTTDYFETLYNNYTSSNVGFRRLITNKLYNLKENKIMTEQESIEYRKKIDETAINILNTLD